MLLSITKVKDMTNEMFGLVGGLFGSIIGIIGGATATYYSIKTTKGPKEKSYMIKLALSCWLILASLIAISIFFIPIQYKSYYSILYMLMLFLTIKYGNKKQQEIRESEKNA